jgi:hypothetical protein
VKRRPKRSPRKPVPSEPSIMPRKVSDTNSAFCPSVEKPDFSVAPSTVDAT